jgi:hypothetical protein
MLFNYAFSIVNVNNLRSHGTNGTPCARLVRDAVGIR